MATSDITKIIELIFTATDDATSVMSDIDKSIGTVDSSFGGLGGRAKGLVEDIALLGLAVTAIATTFATLAVVSAAEYESALLDLQKVMDDSEGSVSQYSETFLQMAINYGKSTTEIVQGVANFKQAGFDVAESLQLQTDALNLSIAGDIAAAEASEYLVSILKGFKAPATDAAEVVDILNEVSNRYATDVQQLAIGMASISPIASTMGFSFAETAGLLTPVIEIFRSGDEAATALKTGLLKLLDDSDEVATALAGIGVSQKDANGHLKSGKDILNEVAIAFKTVDENDKLYLATELVGLHQAGKMVEVFDGLSKSIEITAVGMNSAGSAMKEVEIRMGSAEFKVQQLKTSWDAFLTVAGSSILEEVKPILDSLVKALTSEEGVAIAEALGEVIANWVSNLVVFVDNIQTIYSELSGIEGASAAVDFAKWAGDIDTIKDVLTTANTIIQGLVLSVALVHDGFAGIGNTINGLKNIVNTALNAPLLLVELALLTVLEGLNLIPGMDLSGPIEKLGQSAENLSKVIIDDVTATAPFEYWSDNVANSIIVVDEAINRLGEDGEKTGNKVKDGGDKAKDSMTGLGLALDPLQLALNSCADSADNFSINAEEAANNTGKIGNAAKEGVEGLKSFVEVTEDGIAVFNDNYVALGETTEALAGVTEGTKKNTEANKNAAAELAKQVDQMIKFKLGLEEIQSKERVSIFEMQTKVDLAQIEATSKAFETMFTSIDDGISSTGETLVGLFGLMGQASTTPFGQQALLEAIEKEQELRQKEFDLQEKLIEAQIEYMAMKSQAIRTGEALINISADGLEPEIEAFMWQILKRIQVRANADGAEFLLGL